VRSDTPQCRRGRPVDLRRTPTASCASLPRHGVHAVNLKNRLRDIETDRANLAHGRLPSCGSFRRNHLMALRCRRVGAVHSIIHVIPAIPACPVRR
jgi:hypothetical protein